MLLNEIRFDTIQEVQRCNLIRHSEAEAFCIVFYAHTEGMRFFILQENSSIFPAEQQGSGRIMPRRMRAVLISVRKWRFTHNGRNIDK